MKPRKYWILISQSWSLILVLDRPDPSRADHGLTLNHAITQPKLNRTLSNFKHNLFKTQLTHCRDETKPKPDQTHPNLIQNLDITQYLNLAIYLLKCIRILWNWKQYLPKPQITYGTDETQTQPEQTHPSLKQNLEKYQYHAISQLKIIRTSSAQLLISQKAQLRPELMRVLDGLHMLWGSPV